jgi:hypothetical protein
VVTGQGRFWDGDDQSTLGLGPSYLPVASEGLCLSNLFKDDMVLQRDKPIHVWDWRGPSAGGRPPTLSTGGRRH